MRSIAAIIVLLGTTLLSEAVYAQTADDITTLIGRLVELDSIDLTKGIKFRSGLEPSLFAVDANESKMIVLKDPYAPQGKNWPGAAGWYRTTFTVPEKLGKFAVPAAGYNLGVESNFVGGWELYAYNNDKPAGAMIATPTKIYAMRSFPIHEPFEPHIQSSTDRTGDKWIDIPKPKGMTNGAKGMAVTFDGKNDIIVAGCWSGGLWRYVEPTAQP